MQARILDYDPTNQGDRSASHDRGCMSPQHVGRLGGSPCRMSWSWLELVTLLRTKGYSIANFLTIHNPRQKNNSAPLPCHPRKRWSQRRSQGSKNASEDGCDSSPRTVPLRGRGRGRSAKPFPYPTGTPVHSSIIHPSCRPPHPTCLAGRAVSG